MKNHSLHMYPLEYEIMAQAHGQVLDELHSATFEFGYQYEKPHGKPGHGFWDQWLEYREAAEGASWCDILTEEVAEALLEADREAVDELAAELRQVAAMATLWLAKCLCERGLS